MRSGSLSSDPKEESGPVRGRGYCRLWDVIGQFRSESTGIRVQ